MKSAPQNKFRLGLAGGALIFACVCLSLPAHAEILSLDNGTVKVGIDDSKGASITWLSWSSYPKNVVNHSDPGRLIQQSYYAGKSLNRQADGQSKSWSPWSWNPIQGGGVSSWARVNVMELRTNDTLYGETVPKLWDMPNEEAAALMRQWTGFEPAMTNVVVVRCELISKRAPDDLWGPAIPHAQEIPACYFTRNFSEPKTYLGDGKWQLESQPLGPPWGHAQPPRKAMAFFNAEGQGVAIFSPASVKSWNFGPHGSPVTDDPTAGPCMHVAPLDRVSLGPKSAYRFRYWLVVGTETEIASRLDALWKNYSGERAELSDDRQSSVKAGPMKPQPGKMRIKHFVLSWFRSICRHAFAADKPMNVLVLLADDWRYDTLHCAGDPVVQTPNLDRLAGEGLRFTHACCTTAICGVSRATLFTGQWMSRHGDPAFQMFKTPWAETYPGLLRTNGFWVGHVGKWHNGKFPADKFDFGRSYYGTHWITNRDGSTIHVTQKNENDALEFLRTRPTDRPFCLTLAFFATHAEDQNPLQYLPQPQSMSLYQDVTVPVPVNATDESFHRLPPFIANEKNEGRVRWHWRFDTPEKFQTMMKNYYRLATEVDTTCGRVLAELQKEGVLDNTLVIFTGDNGYYHAEHGLADKWYPHQESIRVPLIVRDPRMASAKHGLTNDDFALNVDLAPTILAAAGIKAPARMQGRDLAQLYLSAKKPAWRDEFFYEHATIQNTNFIPSSQALVRKDWKYFYWPDFQTEQLFNLRADPLEEHDLVADPSQQGRLAEMRSRFAELRAAAK